MNSGRGGYYHRAAWSILAFAWLAVTIARSAPAGDTLYALVQGSTFVAKAGSNAVPLQGSFRLVPQISPLDWKNFQLVAVRLESSSAGAAFVLWQGTGHYSFGGRTNMTQQLVLDLTDGTSTVHYDSGVVPLDDRWPEFDLTLTGSSPTGTAIRLVAVPELSRQHFRTVAETTFLDDCANCDRLSFYVPLEGSFDLVQTEVNPLVSRYHLFNIRLSDIAGSAGIELTGEGTLEIGGEVAIQHKWSLQLQARTPAGNRTVTVKNAITTPGRHWPMLKAELAEEGGTALSRLYLTIAAAPFREIWFTTARGLTPGPRPIPANRLSNADILRDSGRVAIPAASLLTNPTLPAGIGVDAFDVVPGGGGIAFSTDQDLTRPVVGLVSEGDLLGSNGVVRRQNRDLLAAFGFMPPAPDVGLDAVSQQSPDEIWFSVRQPVFSERLGISVGRGDLLSSRGEVIRSNATLLSRFQPTLANHDYGLEGFHVWSSGEIWFSVEESFEDKVLGPISDGDLLSDQGYIVTRNLDLVRRFQPVEDVANFGLRGLFVISDGDSMVDAAAVTLSANALPQLTLHWNGPGRVFQVEAAERLNDLFVPVSLITPATEWLIPQDGSGNGRRFFRVRSF